MSINAGDGIIAYDQWAEGNWQIQASNTSQFRGRVRKNISGSYVNTSNFSNQDLSGAYRLFALELDRTNQTLSSWLDGILNDYKLPDPVPLRDNRRFSIMGNRGRNQPTAGSVAEVIGISSVLEEDRIRIQNYLARKWSLPIGQNLGITGRNWTNPGRFGNSMVDLNGSDGGAVVHSTGLSSDLPSATISAWIRPTSSNFHFFSKDISNDSQLSVYLENQRPVFRLLGMNQQTLPGTDNETFWSKGYLQLNQWSHLALTYDMNSKRVRFFLDGELDDEMIFAGNLPLPLSSGFRLGPQDGQEASSTIGSIDDFRMYQRALEPLEIAKIYGDGNGDFYDHSIEFSYSEELRLPSLVEVSFLQDGYPIELQSGSLILSDLQITNGTASTLQRFRMEFGNLN